MTPEEEQAIANGSRILEALERRDYALAIGLGLMVATFVASRIAATRFLISKEYAATILLGCSVVGGFGTALAAGVPPVRAAFAFLGFSTTAIAFWEGVAKHVVKLWRWKARRRRFLPRKFPTLVMTVLLLAFAALPVRAGEILEPGAILVRADGSEVLIERESVLLEREDVARLDELVRELERCRRDRDECRGDQTDKRHERRWAFIATIAGAFVAGFCATRQPAVSPEDFGGR